MKNAIYPGRFDPVTLGHLAIIRRSSRLVDHLIVGVLNNNTKTPLFSVDERVNMLKDVTKDIDNVEILSFRGLLVDFAKEHQVQTIIRGLRAVTDFEYELAMSQTNRVARYHLFKYKSEVCLSEFKHGKRNGNVWGRYQ